MFIIAENKLDSDPELQNGDILVYGSKGSRIKHYAKGKDKPSAKKQPEVRSNILPTEETSRVTKRIKDCTLIRSHL